MVLSSFSLRRLFNLLAHILADTIKHSILPFTNVLPGIAQMHSDIVNQMILLSRLLGENLLPQSSRLREIVVRDLVHKRQRMRSPLFMGFGRRSLLELDGTVRRNVVGVGTVITVDGHGTVTLEVEDGATGLVDRDLLVIRSETVTVGIGVGEETGLQDGVGRGLNSGDGVRGRKGGLFDLGKVVDGVLVEGHLADFAERDFVVGPDLGQVKDVPAELLGFFRREDLDVDGPRGVIARLDLLKEILGGVIGVGSGEIAGLLVVEGLDALVDLEVDLDIVEVSVLVDELQGVAGVTVHVRIAVGGTAIREEDHDLVDGFRVGGQVVPEHVGILQIGLGIALLGVDKEREFGGIAEEKDGRVVHHLHTKLVSGCAGEKSV
jgi:hypothetical protein